MVEAMKNERPVPGDVFEIRWPDERRQYFQFVAIDENAFFFDLVCVYRHVYSKEEDVTLERILADEVELYCHTVVIAGLKDGVWVKFANAEVSIDYRELVFWTWFGDFDWREWRVCGRFHRALFVPWWRKNYWEGTSMYPEGMIKCLERGKIYVRDKGAFPKSVPILLSMAILFISFGFLLRQVQGFAIIASIYIVLALLCAIAYFLRPTK